MFGVAGHTHLDMLSSIISLASTMHKEASQNTACVPLQARESGNEGTHRAPHAAIHLDEVRLGGQGEE